MSFREITAIWQYNEPLKRSELLSTHGVGSLKLTTWGVVMPRAIEAWPLLKTVNAILNEPIPPMPPHISMTAEQWQAGVVAGQFLSHQLEKIEDPRLIRLLNTSPGEGGKGYTALQHLINVPQVELNRFNQFKSNALRDTLPPSAVHFPKYFYDPARTAVQRHLRAYPEAFGRYRQSLGENITIRQARNHFVPPRSARPVAGIPAEDVAKQAAARDVLEPVPIVLICAHGHISDVPWAQFLGTRQRSRTATGSPASNGGLPGLYPRLFDEAQCCDDPQLLWQNQGRTTDSFAGVKLSCGNCKSNTDLSVLPRIRPICRGHRPWIGTDNQEPCSEQMQYALTTGTNLYFPVGFNGIYLPEKLLSTAPLANPAHLTDIENRYEEALEDTPDFSRSSYWIKRGPKLLEKFGLIELEAEKLRAAFLREPLIVVDHTQTATEQLKREEYELFTRSTHQQEKDFSFTNVPLNQYIATTSREDGAPLLAGRLSCARRVDELRLTKVQLAFTRVQGLDPDHLDDDVRFNVRPQRIHKQAREDVKVLPALTSNGEGIFLELDITAVAKWEKLHKVKEACNELQNNRENPLSGFQQQLAEKLSPRLLLVHTLAHLLIRELEWKCGYPAASLNERTYVSSATNDFHPYSGQAGLLIYATEGSQGSMGGLTFQARPALLTQLLREALDRALDCPADPICWHADAQAGTPLVRAACFACTMTAETSCELQNTLLDRRLLIDPQYGFFSAWE